MCCCTGTGGEAGLSTDLGWESQMRIAVCMLKMARCLCACLQQCFGYGDLDDPFAVWVVCTIIGFWVERQ